MHANSSHPPAQQVRIAYVASARGQKTYGAFAEDPSLDITVYDMGIRRSRIETIKIFLRIARSLFTPQRPHAIVWDTFSYLVLVTYMPPVLWLARLRRTVNLLRLRGNLAREVETETGRNDQSETKRKFLIWLQKSILRLTIRQVDCLLPVSHFLGTETLAHLDLFTAVQIAALPTYIDLDRFKPTFSTPKEQVRRQLELAEDAPILLSISNFDYWEKASALLDFLPAFEQLCAQHPSIRWLIGGSGKHHARFMHELAASPVAAQVTVLGWIPNAVDYLQACDMLVHFSQLEGLPNVILEAAACGKAVIANPHPTMQDCVVDGETGFLVDPADVERTVHVISSYLHDPNRQMQMGQAARAFVTEHYSAQAITHRFRAILGALGVGSGSVKTTAVTGSPVKIVGAADRYKTSVDS